MEIPEGWELESLESLADNAATIRYGVVQIGENTPNGVPIVPIKYINKISTSDLHLAAAEIERKYVNSRVGSGDVLISVKGTIGEVGIVPDGFYGNIAREIARIRPSKGVDSAFLAYQLRAEHTQRRMHRLIVGTTRLEFSIKELKKFVIPIPPLSEQQRIAEILGTWDQAIAVCEELIAASEAQKKALIQQLLTGKRRLPGFDGEWQEVRLEDVVGLWKGKQKGRAELTSDGPVAVINGGISASGYTEESNAPADTITISEGGNSCGYVALQDEDFWCGGHCYALLKPKMDVNFLFAQLKHSQRQIMRLRVGSGLPNIQKKDLIQLKLVQPPIKEQKAIGGLFLVCDDGISQLQAKLQILKTEKAALMQQLLTGKRRVNLMEAVA